MNVSEFVSTRLITVDSRDEFVDRLEKINWSKSKDEIKKQVNKLFLAYEVKFLETYFQDRWNKKQAEQLKQEVLKVDVVKMWVPFLVRSEFAKKVVNWWVSKGRYVVVQAEFDADLWLGVVVEWQGKRWDLSFKNFVFQHKLE